jgi:hypothetical protein
MSNHSHETELRARRETQLRQALHDTGLKPTDQLSLMSIDMIISELAAFDEENSSIVAQKFRPIKKGRPTNFSAQGVAYMVGYLFFSLNDRKKPPTLTYRSVLKVKGGSGDVASPDVLSVKDGIFVTLLAKTYEILGIECKVERNARKCAQGFQRGTKIRAKSFPTPHKDTAEAAVQPNSEWAGRRNILNSSELSPFDFESHRADHSQLLMKGSCECKTKIHRIEGYKRLR